MNIWQSLKDTVLSSVSWCVREKDTKQYNCGMGGVDLMN